MSILIQPKLTLVARPMPHSLQTVEEIPIPVMVPTLSIRHRAALLMLLTSLWLMDIVIMLLVWQLTIDVVYCFVLTLIAFLVGCMVTGILVTRQYRSQIEDAPLLITQKVRAVQKSDLAQLTTTVTMDTTGYLEVVRISRYE